MEKTVFMKIIDREIPAEILFEDTKAIVILNRFPNIPGETLIIPKKPLDYIFDLDDETYGHLMELTKKIARALDATFSTLRTCVVIEGFDVPHVHVRLYPVTSKHLDLTQGPAASDEELKRIGDSIRPNLI